MQLSISSLPFFPLFCAMCEKYAYLEFFCSVFSHTRKNVLKTCDQGEFIHLDQNEYIRLKDVCSLCYLWKQKNSELENRSLKKMSMQALPALSCTHLPLYLLEI